MTDSSQHSIARQIVDAVTLPDYPELADLAHSYLSLEEQLEDYERAEQAWQRNYDLIAEQKKRLLEQYEDAQATITTLEVACDHHRMFWQKAVERERGLKEQLETAEQKLTDIRAIDRGWPTTMTDADKLREVKRIAGPASNPANNLNLGEQAQENALGASSAASEPK